MNLEAEDNRLQTRRSLLELGLLASTATVVPFSFSLAQSPTRPRRGYLPARFGQVHYRIVTNSSPAMPPLVCLHNAPFSGRVFETVLSVAGSERSAFAPDLPGYGDSRAPNAAPAIDDYAGAVADALEELAIDEFDVLGVGVGACVAVALALANPETVGRIALINPPDPGSATPQPASVSEDGDYLSQLWERYRGAALPGLELDRFAEQFPDVVRRPGRSWWAGRAASEYPIAEKLGQLRQPALLVNASQKLIAAPLPPNVAPGPNLDARLGFLTNNPEQTLRLTVAGESR